MTREEAIEWMEETIQDAEKLLDKCSSELKEEILEQNEVFKIAISALRSTPQPGKPLTLDQLRMTLLGISILALTGCFFAAWAAPPAFLPVL